MKKNLFRFLFLASLIFSVAPAFASSNIYTLDSFPIPNVFTCNNINNWIYNYTELTSYIEVRPCDYTTPEYYEGWETAWIDILGEVIQYPDNKIYLTETTDETTCEALNYNECIASEGYVKTTLVYYYEGNMPASSILTIGLASSTDILATTGTLFTDLWKVIVLVVGVPLGLGIVGRVIGLI